MVRQIGIITFTLLLCIAGYASAQTGQSVHLAQGSSVTLRADAEGALSYLWFHNNEPIDGFHDQRITVSKAGTYAVMALGENCDSDLSDPVEVVVDFAAAPITVDMQIRNTPDRSIAAVNETINYQLLIANNSSQTASGVAVTARLPDNVSYETIVGPYSGTATYHAATHELHWLPDDIAASQSEQLTFNVRAARAGMASQLAIVTTSEDDSYIDDNEATAMVEVVALEVPNVFTPNGDGINDQFEIRGLTAYPENQLIIFNRWGNEVMRTAPYRNDWDGANLSEGTYYYVLELRFPNGRWQTFKGFITVIRNTNH